MNEHLILYDGICGLCNGLNRFVLKRDRRETFRYASLQSRLGHELLERHGRDADQLDTFYVLADYGTPQERLLSKSSAALFVLRQVGGAWSLSRALAVLPRRLLDAGYDLVARHRYRWFGREESCLLPEPRYRAKFLDV